MKFHGLNPPVKDKVRFQFRKLGLVPSAPGCYCLANYAEEILYIGKTQDLQRRIKEHVLGDEKTAQTDRGIAFWVCFRRVGNIHELGRLERGWMNEYQINEGKKPPFNKNLPGV